MYYKYDKTNLKPIFKVSQMRCEIYFVIFSVLTDMSYSFETSNYLL